MTETEVETIIQRLLPDTRLRIITNDASKLLAKDFTEFLRTGGTLLVRTLPDHLQSNVYEEVAVDTPM